MGSSGGTEGGREGGREVVVVVVVEACVLFDFEAVNARVG